MSQRIEVMVMTAGGVSVERFADPALPGGVVYLPVRVYFAYPDAPGDGLLSEVRANLSPERRVPWASRAAKAEALASVASDAYPMTAAEREALARHVRTTPCYE